MRESSIKNLHISPRCPSSTVSPSLSFAIASSIFYRLITHLQSWLRRTSSQSQSRVGWYPLNSFQNLINQDNQSLDCYCHYYQSHHRCPYTPWEANLARSRFLTKIHCVPPQSVEKLSLLSPTSSLKYSTLAGPRLSWGLYDILKVTSTRLALCRGAQLLWLSLPLSDYPFLQLWWYDWLGLPHSLFRTVFFPWMLQIFLFSSHSVLGGWVDLRKTSSVWFLLQFQLSAWHPLCVKLSLLF